MVSTTKAINLFISFTATYQFLKSCSTNSAGLPFVSTALIGQNFTSFLLMITLVTSVLLLQAAFFLQCDITQHHRPYKEAVLKIYKYTSIIFS
jgi:hypothetical protein